MQYRSQIRFRLFLIFRQNNTQKMEEEFVNNGTFTNCLSQPFLTLFILHYPTLFRKNHEIPWFDCYFGTWWPFVCKRLTMTMFAKGWQIGPPLWCTCFMLHEYPDQVVHEVLVSNLLVLTHIRPPYLTRLKEFIISFFPPWVTNAWFWWQMFLLCAPGTQSDPNLNFSILITSMI